MYFINEDNDENSDNDEDSDSDEDSESLYCRCGHYSVDTEDDLSENEVSDENNDNDEDSDSEEAEEIIREGNFFRETIRREDGSLFWHFYRDTQKNNQPHAKCKCGHVVKYVVVQHQS